MSEPYRRPTVASCTFVRQPAVCPTKVLALRDRCGAPESRCLRLVIRKEPRLKMNLNHADLEGEPQKSLTSFAVKNMPTVWVWPEQSTLKQLLAAVSTAFQSVGRAFMRPRSASLAFVPDRPTTYPPHRSVFQAENRRIRFSA